VKGTLNPLRWDPMTNNTTMDSPPPPVVSASRKRKRNTSQSPNSPKKAKSPSTTVLRVRQLPPKTSKKLLETLFAQYGDIQHVSLIRRYVAYIEYKHRPVALPAQVRLGTQVLQMECIPPVDASQYVPRTLHISTHHDRRQLKQLLQSFGNVVLEGTNTAVYKHDASVHAILHHAQPLLLKGQRVILERKKQVAVQQTTKKSPAAPIQSSTVVASPNKKSAKNTVDLLVVNFPSQTKLCQDALQNLMESFGPCAIYWMNGNRARVRFQTLASLRSVLEGPPLEVLGSLILMSVVWTGVTNLAPNLFYAVLVKGVPKSIPPATIRKRLAFFGSIQFVHPMKKGLLVGFHDSSSIERVLQQQKRQPFVIEGATLKISPHRQLPYYGKEDPVYLNHPPTTASRQIKQQQQRASPVSVHSEVPAVVGGSEEQQSIGGLSPKTEESALKPSSSIVSVNTWTRLPHGFGVQGCTVVPYQALTTRLQKSAPAVYWLQAPPSSGKTSLGTILQALHCWKYVAVDVFDQSNIHELQASDKFYFLDQTQYLDKKALFRLHSLANQGCVIVCAANEGVPSSSCPTCQRCKICVRCWSYECDDCTCTPKRLVNASCLVIADSLSHRLGVKDLAVSQDELERYLHLFLMGEQGFLSDQANMLAPSLASRLHEHCGGLMCHSVTILQYLFPKDGIKISVDGLLDSFHKINKQEFLEHLFQSRFFSTLDASESAGVEALIKDNKQPSLCVGGSLCAKGILRQEGDVFVIWSPLVLDIFSHHFLMKECDL